MQQSDTKTGSRPTSWKALRLEFTTPHAQCHSSILRIDFRMNKLLMVESFGTSSMTLASEFSWEVAVIWMPQAGEGEHGLAPRAGEGQHDPNLKSQIHLAVLCE